MNNIVTEPSAADKKIAQSNNRKYNIVLPDGRQTTWTQEQISAKGEELAQKYPKAKVYGYMPYEPGVEYNDNYTYNISLGDGRQTNWDKKQWAEKGKELLAKYPDAKVSVVDPTDLVMEYRREKKDAIERRIEELSNNPVTQNALAWEQYRKTQREIAGHSVSGAGPIKTSKQLDEEATKDKQYQNWAKTTGEELQKARLELAQNDFYQEECRDKSAYFEKLANECAYDKDDPQNASDKKNYAYAEKLNMDTAKTYVRPFASEDDHKFNVFIRNAVAGVKDTATDKDWYSMGITELARDSHILGIFRRLEDKGLNLGEMSADDYDRELTPGEKALVFAFLNNADAQAQRARTLGYGYNAGVTATDSIAFMAQFFIAGGVAPGASKLLGKAGASGLARFLARGLSREGSQQAIGNAVRSGAVKATERLGINLGSGATGRTVAGKVVKAAGNVAEGVYKYGLRPIEKGLWVTAIAPSTYVNLTNAQLEFGEDGKTTKLNDAFWPSIADSLIENWSEMVGEGVQDLTGLIGKGIGAVGKKTLGKTTFGQWGRWMLDKNGVKVALGEGGFNGFFGEMAEEWIGNAARVGMGLMSKDEFKDFASLDNQVEMAAAFAPMSLIGVAGNAVATGMQAKEYEKISKQFESVLANQGYTQEEIDGLMHRKFATQDDIKEALEPVLQTFVRNAHNGQVSMEDYRTVLEFANASAQHEVLNSARELERERMRQSEAESISQQLGGTPTEQTDENGATSVHYANDGKGRFSHMIDTELPTGETVQVESVTVVTDDKGNQSYFIGSTGTQVMLKDAQSGEIHFMEQSDYNEKIDSGELTSQTSTLTNYLDERVRQKIEIEERAREDKAHNTNRELLNRRFEEDPSINLGTEENPLAGQIIAVEADGVVVDFGSEVELNGVKKRMHKISYEQAARAAGVQLVTEKEAKRVAQEIERQEKQKTQLKIINTHLAGKSFIHNGQNYTFVRETTTPDSKGMVNVIAMDEDGVVEEVSVRWDTLLDQAMSEQKKAQMQAESEVAVANQSSEQSAEDGVLRDFRGNEIPLDDSGKVDKKAFKKKDAEAYYRWNDERRGGRTDDSMQSLQADINERNTRIGQIDKALESETDPDVRDNLYDEKTALLDEVKELTSIYDKYAQNAQSRIAEENFTKALGDVVRKLATATTDVQFAKLQEIKRKLVREYYAKKYTVKERAEIDARIEDIQEALADTDVPVTVTCYADVAGLLEGRRIPRSDIDSVLDKLGDVEISRRFYGTSLAVKGFKAKGEVFILADSFEGVDGGADKANARVTYFHERQHILNRLDGTLIRAILGRYGADKSVLYEALERLIGPNAASIYKGYDAVVLADEVSAFTMERVNTDEEWENYLAKAGLDKEYIETIKKYLNGKDSNDFDEGREQRPSYDNGSERADGSVDGTDSQGTSGDEHNAGVQSRDGADGKGNGTNDEHTISEKDSEVINPSYLDPRKMSDEEKQMRGALLINANQITVGENSIVATEKMSVRKAAEKWWDENNPEPLYYETEVGEVEINKNSIKDSLAHRYSQAKLDAITGLADGFENAVYLGTMPDSRERGVLDHYFAFPIIYKKEVCYVFCRALQDANVNRLYVHEVFVADKIKKGDTLQTAASKPHGGISLYKDILANVLDLSSNEEGHNRYATAKQSTETVGDSQETEQSGTLISSNINSPAMLLDKCSESSEETKTLEREIAEEEGKVATNPSNGADGKGNESAGGVRLSDALDENGKRFVLSPSGEIDFGEVSEDSGLPSAPIRLSEGYQDKYGKGYGLLHIEANHGKQIRNAGYGSVIEFISFIANNYDKDNILVGKKRHDGSITYLLRVTDKHDNTIFIEMSEDGSYWNVNSAGIFRKGYSNKKETVVKTEPRQPKNAISSDSSLSEEKTDGIIPSEPNGKSTISTDKGSESSEETKTLEGKIAEEEGKDNTNPSNGADGKGNESTGGVGRPLTAEEADSLISQMEEHAEQAEDVELTPENWIAQFGEDGIVETPIGKVKMGENQYFKLARQGRSGKLGMVKPTLVRPDAIIRDNDRESEETHRRQYAYVFVKTFVKGNGSRFYYFTSVTVDVDNHEVVISNQEKSKNRISKLLQNGNVTWIDTAFSLHPTAQIEESVPLDDSRRPTQSDNQSTSLGINSSERISTTDKGSESSEETKTLEGKIAEEESKVDTNPSEAQKEAGNDRSVNDSQNKQTERTESAPKPIGEGVFGAIYDQFKGKAKEAIDFLKRIKTGEAIGALHHKNIGDISIVWGNKKAGLQKILAKHPEVIDNLQEIIGRMEIVSESDNRVKLASSTHFAVISKEYLGQKRENWLLTAFEMKNSALDNTMDTGEALTGERNDTATSQNTVSTNKGNKSSEENNTHPEELIKGERWESTPEPKRFKSGKRHDSHDVRWYIGKKTYGSTVAEKGMIEDLTDSYGSYVGVWNAYERGEILLYGDAPAILKASIEAGDNHYLTELGLERERKKKEAREKQVKTDAQGNPLNEDGTLKIDVVKSIDELTDADFTTPTRSVQLPELSKKVSDAIGADGKPVIIKKNIFERNNQNHPEVTPKQAREILSSALYRPDLYGQNQKTTRPYNWIVINTKDKEGQNRLVVLEVSDNKDNIEIVHWYNVDNRGVEKVKRQAQREGGHILILPSETEEAGALSGRQSDLSSTDKGNNQSSEKQTNRASGKIDDVGEKIGGARKDLAIERIELYKRMSQEERDKKMDTPDKVLSIAQIKNYVAKGKMSAEDGAQLAALNQVCKSSFYVMGDRYVEAVKNWSEGKPLGIEAVDAYFNEKVDDENTQYDLDFEEHRKKMNELNKKMVNASAETRKALDAAYGELKMEGRRRTALIEAKRRWRYYKDILKTYTDLQYPVVSRNLGGTFICAGALGKYYVLSSVTTKRGYVFPTYEEALKWLDKKRPALDVKTKEDGAVGKGKAEDHLYVGKSTSGWYIIKSRSIPGNIALNNMTFTSKSGAEEYLASNREALASKEATLAGRLMGTNIGSVERVGKDWRKGRDITAEEFREAFGFRGVEFGNYVTQLERADYLNKTYDAIMDFCESLGISPKAFSLNGELGFAFGARGEGKAAAHYEPRKIVINLTKTKGVGSLAHEWWHALDNYLVRSATGEQLSYVTEGGDVQRAELRDAFQSFLKEMRTLPYRRRSINSGDYWGRTIEMTARVFQVYMHRRLAEQGIVSPILTRDDVLYKEGEEEIPMPSNEEMETLKPYLDHIFDVLQERVDEQTGNVVLFQVGEDGVSELKGERRLAYESARMMLSNAGIEVEELSEEAINQLAEMYEPRQAYLHAVMNNVDSALSALKSISEGTEEVKNAMYRDDLSQYGGTNEITFIWGKPGNAEKDYKGGSGISHILAKHGKSTLIKLIEVIAEGDVKRYVEGNKTVILEKDGYEAVLALTRFGDKESWLLSGWNTNRDEEKEQTGENGEVSAASIPTQESPTFSRADLGAVVSDAKVRKEIENAIVTDVDDAQFHKGKSERADWLDKYVFSISYLFGGDKKAIRKEMVENINQARREAKELYKNILSGNFNDVTLRQINDYIDNATNANRFYRPVSQRLPERALLSLYKGERTGSVDALFSRICESTVPAYERTRASGRRAIEARKEELLEKWAKATGNWHEGIEDFTSKTTPIDEGTDSKVFLSDDGSSVIKASKGKFDNRKFPSDIDYVNLFNAIFPSSAYRVLGYGRMDGKFVRFLEQSFVDFSTATPLTEEERVKYMGRWGFTPRNEERTMFSNGKFVVSDLQRGNIVRDADGNVRVIDADVKLHTKDIGGEYSYPPVEMDTEAPELMTVYHGSGARFDKFDHSHMGEGTGEQSYGWGSYVTELEDVGRIYAKSGSSMLYKGRKKEEFDVQRMSDLAIIHMLSKMEDGWSFSEAKSSELRWAKADLIEYRRQPNTPDVEKEISETKQLIEALESLDESGFSKSPSHIYTVEIPDNTGENYLEWIKPLTKNQIDAIRKGLAHLMESQALPSRLKEEMLQHNNGYRPVINISDNGTGGDVYGELLLELPDEYASKFLNSLGYVGIKYPTGRYGGREDWASNYVIFNEKDLEIKDRVDFLRDGKTIYGMALGDRVLLNEERLNPNTPVHEYTHIWDRAVRRNNPELWARGVELMKQTSLWKTVSEDANYAGLDENGIASEVHSRLVGEKGEETLNAMSKEVLEGNGGIFDTAAKMSVIERLRSWLKEFWYWVKDTMTPWSREEASMVGLNEFVNMPMADLARETRIGEDEVRFSVEDIARMETPMLRSKGTFKNLQEAEQWAKENLQGKAAINVFTSDVIYVGRRSVKEMLNEKTLKKSDSVDNHLRALRSVLDFIKLGIPAEIHKDTHGRDFDVMRLYNALDIDGHLYRVKSTVRKVITGERYYTYEIQEMELIEERRANRELDGQSPVTTNSSINSISDEVIGGTQSPAVGLDGTDNSRPQTYNSISGANLLKGVKKTNSEEYILPEIEGLADYSADEVKQIVRDYIEDTLAENGMDARVLGLELIGSRLRGNAREDSDLDVVVEYEGTEREDDMFNLLHDEDSPLEIDSVSVDINPISKEETGTLADYMERSAEYDEEVLSNMYLEEEGTTFRVVEDKETLDRLNNGPTIKVYRAMQLWDGVLYPPMAGKVNGKWQFGIPLDKLGTIWEQSDERPELANAKGFFKLDKGNGKVVWARYNPYFHTSLTPLNDQFSSAQDRPELVTVEVEVPVSELTSGYKAYKAKDAVGKVEWKAGVIQSKLSGKRTVVLSRWDRPMRIVPDSEVADVIVDMFNGKKITMPSNVVTPSLRAELEKRGVPFVETDNQGKRIKNKKDQGKKVKNKKDSDIRFDVSESYTAEEQSIIDRAKEDGTYMKAPNGKPSNLNERQWAQVRTKAFKAWFGDWEKAARIEKLRGSEDVKVEYKEEYPLNSDAAQDWIKNNLRGEYTIEDTKEIVSITRIGAEEVTSHSRYDEAHLKSISAIPEILKNAIFLEEADNAKGNGKFDSYRYYVVGLDIDGELYTAKVVIGVKQGKRYYDHRLTQIEKGTLIDNIGALSTTLDAKKNAIDFTTEGNASLPPYIASKDTKLLSILKNDASKVVDENGEPKVVYHGTDSFGFAVFDKGKSDDARSLFFTDNDNVATGYANARAEFNEFLLETGIQHESDLSTERGDVYDLYLNMRNPVVIDAEGNEWNEVTIGVRWKWNGKDSEVLKDVVNRLNENGFSVYCRIDDKGKYEFDYDSTMEALEDIFDVEEREMIEDEEGIRFMDICDNLVPEINSDGNCVIVTNTRTINGLAEKGGYDGVVFNNIIDSASSKYSESSTVYALFDANRIKSATDNVGEFSADNDDIRFRIYGGNDGYVGYSMSKRAAQAREEGRYPKTDFIKAYKVKKEVLAYLVDAGVVDDSEWHHTSKLGNKTTFYGWEEDRFQEFYSSNKGKIDNLVGEHIKSLSEKYPLVEDKNPYVDTANRADYTDETNSLIRAENERYYGSLSNGVLYREYGEKFFDDDEYREKIISQIGDSHLSNLEKIYLQMPEVDKQVKALKDKRDEWWREQEQQQNERNREERDFVKKLESLFYDSNDVRFDVSDIRKVNDTFNRELKSLTVENANNKVLYLGMPSDILRSVGIRNNPLKLYGNKIIKKMTKHGFELSDINNLPVAVADPVAVFKGVHEDSYAVLTELKFGDNIFLVTLSIGKGNDVDFNIISSVYDKTNEGVMGWIEKGKGLYYNKEKMLDYLRISAPIAEAQSNQAPSSATNIVETFDNPTLPENNDVRFDVSAIDGKSTSELSREFDRALDLQKAGNLPSGYIYRLGYPGSILRSTGFPYAPIELAPSHLTEKMEDAKHPFGYDDVKGLVNALQYPMAVFAYGDRGKAQNVIVKLTRNGKNFVVGVHFNQLQRGVRVSDIRGLFPKDNAQWLNWISQSKALYLDKAEIQALIDQQRTSLAEVEYLDLDSIAKVVKDFDNPIAFEDNLYRFAPEYEDKQALKDIYTNGLPSSMDSTLLDIDDELSVDVRWTIAKAAADKGFDFVKATADYLAGADIEEVRPQLEKVREMMRKDIGDEQAVSLEDVQWALYQSAHKGENSLFDYIGRMSKAEALGHSPQEDELLDKVDDGTRFSISEEMEAQSATDMYNRAAGYWRNRIKEGLVDMNESVNDLVEAIEKQSGQKADSFEDIRLALNQQSSRGLHDMNRYTSDYLEPMWNAIKSVMKDTGLSYDEVCRYVILKHALERNIVFARRDARNVYKEDYAKLLSGVELNRKEVENRRKKAIVDGDNSAITQCDAELLALDNEKSRLQSELQAHLDAVEKGTDEKFLENRKRDYSGLTSMYSDYPGLMPKDSYASEVEYEQEARRVRKPKYDNVSDMEKAAEAEVKAVEAKDPNAIAELWAKVNAATKATLTSQYRSNMLTKEQYESIKEQFQYYVPLRGFTDVTAEDVWDYYNESKSGSYAPTLVGAKGRTSQAENPFIWIGTMASTAIAQNLKNRTKLSLYYFVANRADKQDLVTVRDVWYKYDQDATAEYQAQHPRSLKRIFTPVYPPVFAENLDSDSAKAAYDLWEEDMKKEEENGNAYRGTQKMDVGDQVAFVSGREKPQHLITMKVRGRELALIINGNPRAAQAINGELNIEASKGYQKVFGPVLRFMSAVNTSYNPEFWISNAQRDILYAWMSTMVQGKSGKGFFKNLVSPKELMRMAREYKAGTLGNGKLETYYKEFAEGGGITGFTVISGNEVWEKKIQSYLEPKVFDKMKNSKFLEFFQDLGEAIEQMSRFSAYITARDEGKSIADAVSDSKEITVNFNRKGSGKNLSFDEVKKLTRKNGRALTKAEQAGVLILSQIAPAGRSLYMFFNAGVQGCNNLYQLAKKNPKRFGVAVGAFFALGALQALVHSLIDDDDDYLDMPDNMRRGNILLGAEGVYFKWAMPQEMRSFYALGDIYVNKLMGRSPDTNVIWDTMRTLSEPLPITLNEGVAGLVPSYVRPLFELVTNKDYSGRSIYNGLQYLSEEERSRTPRYKQAYGDTNRLFIDMSHLMNVLTGGDEYTAGAVNIIPESMQHIVESYGGGLLTTLNKTSDFASGLLDLIPGIDTGTELSARRTPFLNRVLVVSDDNIRNSYANRLYYYYKGEAEHTKKVLRQAKKDRNLDAYQDIVHSKDFEIYKVYERYRKSVERYQDNIKDENDSHERRLLMRQQDEIKKQMIRDISDL